MRIAVLTLTRDRLVYTKHCFASLRENAGCEYSHYVLDQGSGDETPDWLIKEEDTGRVHYVERHTGNLGISRALNRLLDCLDRDYDLIVKFDNDCELTVPDTLARIAAVSTDEWILSPRVLGLLSPPSVETELTLGGERVGTLPHIGGIFMAVPVSVYERFRYSESNPTWGMDDNEICRWHTLQGGKVGYLLDVTVNHYRTTSVQNRENPDYWRRKRHEMGLR